MARRIFSRINSAHVIATIALFAALGGGYAVAFSGSGSLQKGAGQVAGSNFTTVRSLTGIGSIQGNCVNDGDDQMIVRFLNTSGVQIAARNLTLTNSNVDYEIPVNAVTNGSNFDKTVVQGDPATFEFFLYPNPTGGAKSPQAHVMVHAINSGANCSDARMTVLALNTQQ